MTWEEFQQEKKFYKDAWNKLKDGFTGASRKFLDKSRIVVYCGRQFELDDEFMAVAKACPAFFADQEAIKEMIETDKEIEKIASIFRKESRNDAERADQNKGEVKSRSLLREGDAYKSNALAISDRWCIEVRFPYVDIDMIQEVKQSPYCDKDKTMMRAPSIRVVLKKKPV